MARKENWQIGVQCKGGMNGDGEDVQTFYIETYYGDTARALGRWLSKDPRVIGVATFKKHSSDSPTNTFGKWDNDNPFL